MMPLCTTASLSVACGWALFSVGLPWVAQRVWPMPMVPCSGSLCSRVSRLRSLPSARRRVSAPRFERGDAGGIVAAIFEALERVDELPRHRLTAENPNNPAQVALPPRRIRHALLCAGAGFRKIKMRVPIVSKSGSQSLRP